jgi:predicted SPOUT superfamily RNA methylase MTH1
VNVCPGQGSRTIRTEEAVWLALMGIKDVVMRKGRS